MKSYSIDEFLEIHKDNFENLNFNIAGDIIKDKNGNLGIKPWNEEEVDQQTEVVERFFYPVTNRLRKVAESLTSDNKSLWEACQYAEQLKEYFLQHPSHLVLKIVDSNLERLDDLFYEANKLSSNNEEENFNKDFLTRELQTYYSCFKFIEKYLSKEKNGAESVKPLVAVEKTGLLYLYSNTNQGRDNLKELRLYLKDNGLISPDVSLQNFRLAFSGTHVKSPILWKGTVPELAFFCKLVGEKELIGYRKGLWDSTVFSFSKLDGSRFSSNALSVKKNNTIKTKNVLETAASILEKNLPK